MTLSEMPVGTKVINLGKIQAKVVSITTHIDGSQSPVLKEIDPSTGKLFGGKWVANPAKCSPLE